MFGCAAARTAAAASSTSATTSAPPSGPKTSKGSKRPTPAQANAGPGTLPPTQHRGRETRARACSALDDPAWCDTRLSIHVSVCVLAPQPPRSPPSVARPLPPRRPSPLPPSPSPPPPRRHSPTNNDTTRATTRQVRSSKIGAKQCSRGKEAKTAILRGRKTFACSSSHCTSVAFSASPGLVLEESLLLSGKDDSLSLLPPPYAPLLPLALPTPPAHLPPAAPPHPALAAFSHHHPAPPMPMPHLKHKAKVAQGNPPYHHPPSAVIPPVLCAAFATQAVPPSASVFLSLSLCVACWVQVY